MPELRMPVGGTTPPAPAVNEVSLYVKADKRFYMQDDTGAEVKLLTDESTLASLSTQLPLTDTGGANPTIAINNVTTSANGAMLFQDKVKLDSATALNTANQIVARDALGNFSANEITATLNGQASTVAVAPALTGDVTSNGTTNATTIANGVITDAKVSPTAAIALSKLAIDPRDRSTHTGLQLASTISDFSTAIDSHLTSTAPIVNAMIANGAAIDLSKLAVDPLDRANHTGTQTAATISDFSTQVGTDISNYLSTNPITNAEVSATAAIDLSKLATDPLARANHTGTQLASTISDFTTTAQAAITEGNGIDVTGGVVTALGTTNRISVGVGGIDIDSAYVGQASINTLGTITTGTWNGSVLGIAYGGTGAISTGEASNNLLAVRTITSSDTLDDQDSHIIADATGSVITIALPAASTLYKYTIKKVDATNNVIINADAGDSIDGASNLTLTTQYQYVTIISDGGTDWHIVAN